MNELQIKQTLFMRYGEFKPALIPKQYSIYTKHIDFVIDEMKKMQENKK